MHGRPGLSKGLPKGGLKGSKKDEQKEKLRRLRLSQKSSLKWGCLLSRWPKAPGFLWRKSRRLGESHQAVPRMWLKYKDLREMTQSNSARSFHVFRCAARCYVARKPEASPAETGASPTERRRLQDGQPPFRNSLKERWVMPFSSRSVKSGVALMTYLG